MSEMRGILGISDARSDVGSVVSSAGEANYMLTLLHATTLERHSLKLPLYHRQAQKRVVVVQSDPKRPLVSSIYRIVRDGLAPSSVPARWLIVNPPSLVPATG